MPQQQTDAPGISWLKVSSQVAFPSSTGSIAGRTRSGLGSGLKRNGGTKSMNGISPGSVPVLETERVILRAHQAGDFDAYAAMWADPEVTRFIGKRARTREESW